MDAKSSGIIACFVLTFIGMVVGFGIQKGGDAPDGFYAFAALMAGVGLYLIISKKGGIGEFKIKF